MKVALLGAGGTIGPAIARDLDESEEVASLRLLDADADALARLEGETRVVDASDEHTLATAIGGCDVLLNAASYRLNLTAMRAALSARCHYVDLGGLYWMTGRQLALRSAFGEANLLALLGMGSSPGKTNVMAVRAVRSLAEPPESICVVAAGRDPAGRGAFPYALRTLIDEVTLRPVVLRCGQPVEIDPLAPGGVVELPAPIGAAGTIHTLHSELRTFGASFGCREASFRLSLAPELLERLRRLAGADDETIAAAARDAPKPSARTISVHRVEASGAHRRVTVTAITEPVERWGAGGGVVSTAAPAAAAVRLLARGEIAARGALPPERCIEPDLLFPELERRGCRFEAEQSEVIEA